LKKPINIFTALPITNVAASAVFRSGYNIGLPLIKKAETEREVSVILLPWTQFSPSEDSLWPEKAN